MSDKNIKPTSLRLQEEDITKFKTYADELGLNQAQAFNSLIGLLELERAKGSLTDRGKEIETFRDTVNKLIGFYINSLEVNKVSEERIREEFKKDLNTKDDVIQQLQKNKLELIARMEEAKENIEALNKDVERSKANIEATNKSLEAQEKQIKTLEANNKMLQEQLKEYKQYKEEYKSLEESYKKAKEEIEVNKGLSLKLDTEKEKTKIYKERIEETKKDIEGYKTDIERLRKDIEEAKEEIKELKVKPKLNSPKLNNKRIR